MNTTDGTTATAQAPIYRTPGGTYEGPGIRHRAELDDAQTALETRLANLILNHTPEADALYAGIPATQGGKVISTDLYRYLAPEFSTFEGRLKFTKATSEPARAGAGDRLRRAIAAPPPLRADRERPILLMVGGGMGNGKSTRLTTEAVDLVDLAYEGIMREGEKIVALIEQALAQGWDVKLDHIHRPFRDAAQAVIARTCHKVHGGRWIHMSDMPDAHMRAQAAFEMIARRYEGNPRVAIRAFLNETEQPVKEVPPASLSANEPPATWVLRNEESPADIRTITGRRLTFRELCILSDETVRRAFDPERFRNGPVPTP
jgi:hypothetical protein